MVAVSELLASARWKTNEALFAAYAGRLLYNLANVSETFTYHR